jgi:hypothetical protein
MGARTLVSKTKSCATRQPVFPSRSAHKTSCNRILERFISSDDPCNALAYVNFRFVRSGDLSYNWIKRSWRAKLLGRWGYFWLRLVDILPEAPERDILPAYDRPAIDKPPKARRIAQAKRPSWIKKNIGKSYPIRIEGSST